MLSEEGVCLEREPRGERGRRRGQTEGGRDLYPVSGAHKTLSAVLKTEHPKPPFKGGEKWRGIHMAGTGSWAQEGGMVSRQLQSCGGSWGRS